MVLSTHDPILAHRLTHSSRHMDHVSARPAPLPLAIHRPHLSSWEQLERAIRPAR